MTSSYPSATGRSHLPGHSAPSMATPAVGDENSRLKENPNAQVDFIKTLPRKDVAFGAQAAMDRDRLPLVAKNEQFADSISAGTSTATLLKEKQISTYDTQVAAHAPTVTSSPSTSANIGSPSASTRPHLIPDTVINMANKAKEMIFGHKHETPHTDTGAYPNMPITTPIPGVSMTSPPLPSSTIASRSEPTTMEKAEEMMGVVQLPGDKSTPIAKFNTTNTGPTTLDKIKNTIATDADKAKNVLTNSTEKAKQTISTGTEKAKQTISSGTEKAKQMMEKEKAAISSGAHQLADKTKEMLGMDKSNTKTVTKTSLKREDDADPDTTLLAQQEFLEPALRKMSVDKSTDKTNKFPMTGTNTSILPVEPKPLEILVQQQDLLEPVLFVESAPVSRSSTNLSMEKESTSKMSEKPDLFGTKQEQSGRHSPNLIDQIASDNPFAIGAEVEDQMAMFMAQRLRSHK